MKLPVASLGEFNPRTRLNNYLEEIKLKIVIFVTIALFIGVSQITSAQGLAERRALKSYQESVLPDLQSKINAAAGFEVPVNIDWEKIAQPGEADSYSNDAYFTNIYFTPLIDALSSIGSDDLGKEALTANLKGINITFNPDTAPASNYANGISFEDGEVTLNFRPFSNADDIKERAEAIIEVLEAKL